MLLRTKVFRPQSLSSPRWTPANYRAYAAAVKMPESAKAIATKERREEYEKECEREKLEEEAAERIRSIRIVPKSPDELYRGLGLDPDLVRDAKREAELKIQRTSKYAWVGLNVYDTSVKTGR
jgi:hypothetical protein